MGLLKSSQLELGAEVLMGSTPTSCLPEMAPPWVPTEQVERGVGRGMGRNYLLALYPEQKS